MCRLAATVGSAKTAVCLPAHRPRPSARAPCEGHRVTASTPLRAQPMPELRPLSNGSFHVPLAGSGHGHRCEDMSITRRCADATPDNPELRCHFRDHTPRSVSTTAAQRRPTRPGAATHAFEQGHSTCWRRGRGRSIETRTEIAVARDGPVGLRPVVITNLCAQRRTLSATGYAAIAVCPAAIDEAVSTPVPSAAPFERVASRGEAGIANQLLPAMRHAFGGHLEKSAEDVR